MSKYSKNKGITPANIMLRLAGILFCLVLITTSMMSGLYARYTAEGNGEDSARVAKWNVGATGNLAEAEVKPAETDGEYSIIVTSNSEVAAEYDIKVTLEKELPEYLTVTLADEKGENKKNPTTASEDKKTLTFDNVGTFAPGNGERTHILTFTMDWSEFTVNAKGLSETYELSFTVDVTITQVD